MDRKTAIQILSDSIEVTKEDYQKAVHFAVSDMSSIEQMEITKKGNEYLSMLTDEEQLQYRQEFTSSGDNLENWLSGDFYDMETFIWGASFFSESTYPWTEVSSRFIGE